MAKIIKGADGMVSVRIDDAYTTNEKHFLTAYVNEDDKKSYFGSFKFLNPKVAMKTLKEAIKESKLEDTVFDGQYPKWIEDEYGISLNANNRVKFYQKLGSSELVPDDEVRDNIYALEVHLKPNKEDGIFLVVARAIVTGKNTSAYHDDLFDDFVGADDAPVDTGKGDKKETTPTIDVAEDDLPF